MDKTLKERKQEQLIDLLSDEQWHSGEEIAARIGFRFGAIIHEARKNGYSIETRKTTHNQFECRIPTNFISLNIAQDILGARQDVFQQTSSVIDIQSAIPQEQIPYLKLLVLFGSRARGDHSSSSDWDFALLFDEELRQQYEPGGGWNCYRSWSVLQQVLGLSDDEIDWVDLKSASELLAHAIARDGVVIYESEPELFEKFRQKSLMTPQQLKAIRHEQKSEITAALKQWGS
jgi:uncharacterized protein